MEYNPPGAMCRLFLLAVINCKMPGTSQSTSFIFEVVKLPLCQAAGNTLINTLGRSKLSHFKDLLICYRLLKNSTVYKFHKGHVATDVIGAGNFKG